MTPRIILALPLLALAACDMPPAATPPADRPAAPACTADSYKGLIGKPKSALTGISLPLGSRVIGPGDAITMDFRADRINVEIGKSGRIEKISCY